MTIPHLIRPDEFFTNPEPCNALKEVPEISLDEEMMNRAREAYNYNILSMIVGAEDELESEV